MKLAFPMNCTHAHTDPLDAQLRMDRPRAKNSVASNKGKKPRPHEAAETKAFNPQREQ